MKLLLPLLLYLCGCAYQSSRLYDPGTGHIVAKARTYTLWDSQSSLSKLRIDSVAVTNKNGSWSPGISISGLTQESSSTNVAEALGTGLGAALKAYTGR